MIQWLCNYMFGGHKQCKSDVHNMSLMNIALLNQIQELKAINNYQAMELEQKIANLETELKQLQEKLAASQSEVVTLSGVLNSEPIMEALGKKNE